MPSIKRFETIPLNLFTANSLGLVGQEKILIKEEKERCVLIFLTVRKVKGQMGTSLTNPNKIHIKTQTVMGTQHQFYFQFTYHIH